MIARHLHHAQALGLFLLVMLGNATTICIVRYLTSASREVAYHPFQILWLTATLAAILFLPKMLTRPHLLRPQRGYALLALRAILEFLAFSASFYAIALQIPLPMQTALTFMTPIFGTVIALLVLREHGTWATYGCVSLGVVGVLVITQPTVETDIPILAIMLTLAAAFGFACCASVIKLLTRSEHSQTIAFYMVSLVSLIALPFSISVWQTPAAADWGWFLALGLIAFFIQQAVAQALSMVPYMTLIPLNFAQLVFVAIIAYLAFDEAIGLNTVFGSVIILSAVIYNAWYAARHAREMAAKEDIPLMKDAA